MGTFAKAAAEGPREMIGLRIADLGSDLFNKLALSKEQLPIAQAQFVEPHVRRRPKSQTEEMRQLSTADPDALRQRVDLIGRLPGELFPILNPFQTTAHVQLLEYRPIGLFFPWIRGVKARSCC